MVLLPVVLGGHRGPWSSMGEPARCRTPAETSLEIAPEQVPPQLFSVSVWCVPQVADTTEMWIRFVCYSVPELCVSCDFSGQVLGSGGIDF